MKFFSIGLGRMGRRHLQIARNMGFDIVGVFDTSAESVKLAQDELGIPSTLVFNSFQEMLDSDKPHAIVISSTAPSHYDYVITAAKAGIRYILCEKPMAVSIDQCKSMINICDKYGSVLAVNHQMQFMPQYTMVKDLINSTEMGGLRSINVSGSNFGLAMNTVHYFEMFRYLTGEEIEKVYFWADENKLPNPRGHQYEDLSGQLRAVSKSGIRLNIELGCDLGHGISVIYNCRYGQIFVDELSGFLRYTHREAQFRDLPTTRYGMPSSTILIEIPPADVIAPTEALWQAMIKGEQYPNGAAGLHAIRALVAANLSAEIGGQPVLTMQDYQSSRNFPWA